ncbi:A disintegrin and metalloproteinase with thrombospondin motifs 7-like isoform X2 [Dermacentor variabilis]|uniref:A disintegrin and metalloproteinase with thrombospondin motifs 7-like isoform X2 n=1 Tax=Dermacentor variabilis TaxID=34621 RepID=UPI003F5B5953
MVFLAIFLFVHFVATSSVIGDRKEFTEESITVYPQVLEAREDGSEKVLIVHKDCHLRLKKASILAGRLLLLNVTENDVIEQYTGLINFTHRIEPVMLAERSSARIAHKIVQIANIQGSCENDQVTEKGPREPSPPEIEMRGAIPQEFGVELHFISDYNHSKHFEGRTDDHVMYVTLFMHSVSLRMDQLTPPVPIGITKIQMTSTDKEEYVALWDNGDLIGNETLKKLNEVVKKDSDYQKSDAVYMATGREMITLIPGGKSSYLLGLSGASRACANERAAVGEDIPGKFSGVTVAAHEIGHLLGSPDDTPGQWGNCKTEDGYLMSRYAKGKRYFTFSNCSKNAIAAFLKLETSVCLKKRINCPIVSFPNKALKLPGNVMSGDAYCKLFYSGFAAAYFLELFAFLKKCNIPCLVKDKRTEKLRFLTTLAPDGTRCDYNDRHKVCKNAICV